MEKLKQFIYLFLKKILNSIVPSSSSTCQQHRMSEFESPCSKKKKKMKKK